ncbi:hypothetical protein ERO13_A10G231400v2 [Gossypium hirsutum]|nr:hypothetical protein ERO13_A10G231400v2 [Gossypium hirsutum]
MKYHVFLSFRGEDTRLNFTTYLLQALESKRLDVFFDEEKLERGEQLAPALSRAIAASNMSIIVLSENYASSKSCLAELSDIMDRYRTKQQIVLPIFYHVNRSDVENLGGSFKTSFDEHEIRRSVDEVKRWKTAFAEVGKLKGWPIDGSISDRLETTHIKGIVAHVMQKLMKHQVFVSLGEDTRLNFSNHLVKALEKVRINVFPDNGTLEKGEKLPLAYSRAISASNLSILVLSKDYASSISSLVELSDIMDSKRKPTDKHIVLPIFYHVDPSDVRNIGGSFKTSFEEHKSKQPADIVQKWKSAFAEIGKLKGWHIEGGKFDRPETKYVENVVEYVLKKLTNIKLRSASDELVGIDDQKKNILKRIKQKDCRVLGLWGMGGQGKTTLAEAVYKEISSEFESHRFLGNVREKIKKEGKEPLRNELLSKLLNSKVDIGTPSIGSCTLTQDRLNKTKILVVLDDVDDVDVDGLNLIDYMGVKEFGFGSKIIITSRNKQVLESGGADTIREVKALNDNDSLQLFSTFAFKQLNPAVGFQDLSSRFVKYTQGNSLALKVLGSDLYKRPKSYWESKVANLKDCPPAKQILKALESSYHGLEPEEKNIFLDIACFFKGESEKTTKHILSDCYKGAECGINKLVDKCLINISFSTYATNSKERYSWIISMHDMLEEMGKDIACQESTTLGKCSRLWSPKHVEQVLTFYQGTDQIKGITSDMSHMDNLRFRHPLVFQNMINLKYIIFYFSSNPLLEEHGYYKKLFTCQLDILFLPDELRYLQWDYYPFTSLSSNFNPKNIVVLKLPHGNMKQLWNEDNHQDLVHLRKINLFSCKNLKKIPNLLGALNLERLDCENCESLVKLPSLAHLTSLKTLRIKGCRSLKKFPEIPNNFYELDLSETGIKKVPDFIERLDRLERLTLTNSMVKDVSSNISKLKSLKVLDLSGCPIVRSPEIPRSLTGLYLSGTQIEEVDLSSNSVSSNSRAKDASSDGCPIVKSSFPTVDVPSPSLMFMCMDRCNSLNLLSELPPYLHELNVHDCTSLKKVSFADQNLYQFDYLDADDPCFHAFTMLFCNCFVLNQESINNIEANAMLKIGSLAKKWAAGFDWGDFDEDFPSFICCFPGNKISGNKFKCQSENSFLSLKIAPNGGSGSRFLVFAICVVANLTYCPALERLECICEYQLIGAGGGNGGGGHEKLRSVIFFSSLPEPEKFMGDYVFILSSINMVDEDKNYEEASFEFKIRYLIFDEEEHYEEEDCEGEDLLMFKRIEVKRCGVHVFYVDAESNADSNTCWYKRSFSNNGEERDGGTKRLK